MNLNNPVKAFIDGQYRCPHGLFGQAIGARMIRQHEPEMDWTITLLHIQPLDHILEIGFGGGKAIERVASLATQGHISGIDLSPTMVHIASRRNVRSITAGKVALHQGNVLSIPFADHQFDTIFSIHTVYFWTDPLQAFHELYRVLKPTGRAVLTFSPGIRGSQGEIIATPISTLLEDQILADMKRTGFTEISLHQGPTSRQFATVTVIGIK